MFPLLLACTQDPGAKDTTPDLNDTAPSCTDERTWYADDDGDTFGDAGDSFFGCEPSDAFVLDASDCDDTDAAVNPAVAEDACEDGVDANCDGADPACGFEPVEDLAEAYTLTGADAEDAGHRLEVSDLTGDGRDDLLIAAMRSNENGGGGYIYAPDALASGTLDALALHVRGDTTTWGAGRAIGTGDMDGDGVADLAFGSPFGAIGGMFVLLGPAADERSLADGIRLMGQAGDYSGHGGDVGDVDGDGVEDVVVGAYNSEGGLGGAFVSYGPVTTDVDLYSEADVHLIGDGGRTGRWIRADGDFNGDGVSDILVASPTSEVEVPGGGGIYMVYGPADALVDLPTTFDGRYIGAYPGEAAGEGLGAGDIDDDGLDDVLMGSYGSDFTGAGHVYFGPAAGQRDTLDADVLLMGGAASQLGSDFEVGDLDGDGDAELLVGGISTAGGAWIFDDLVPGQYDASDATSVMPTLHDGDYTGAAVEIGDLDGDGAMEAILGAPNATTNESLSGVVFIVEYAL
jgi:hypothetical protein